MRLPPARRKRNWPIMPALTEAERDLVLTRWNATARDA
jgi:hypothetical protein